MCARLYLPTILLFYRPHHVCSAQALHAARASGEGTQALPQAMHALDHPIKRVLTQRAIGVALAPRRGRRLVRVTVRVRVRVRVRVGLVRLNQVRVRDRDRGRVGLVRLNPHTNLRSLR